MLHVAKTFLGISVGMTLCGTVAVAGVFDPDCTAEKAARSAATKAIVGVGGRCTPAEAAKDITKDKVGIEDKGPLEKRRKDDGPMEKMRDKD